MFMDVLPACMSIHHMYTVLIEAEKGIISPGPLCGLLFRGSGFDPLEPHGDSKQFLSVLVILYKIF